MFLRSPVLYALMTIAVVGQVAQAVPAWFPSSLSSCFDRFWSPSPASTDLIEDCSDDSYILKINDITLTPAFPKPGKDLTIDASGTLSEMVEDGALAQVTVKLGLVTLIRKTFDLCQEAKENNVEVQCPIAAGPVKIRHTVTLPKEIPRGDFRVNVDAYTASDDDLACLRAHVDFRKHRFGHISHLFDQQEENSYVFDL